MKQLGSAVQRLARSAREFSVSISNVPGPADAGQCRRAQSAAPVLLVEPAAHHALRISAISCAGDIGIGLCTDPQALPDIARLADAIEVRMPSYAVRQPDEPQTRRRRGLGDSSYLQPRCVSLAMRVLVGISAKPALVSGQELGWRLSRPDELGVHSQSGSRRDFRGSIACALSTAHSSGVYLASSTVSVERGDGSRLSRKLRRAGDLDRSHQRILAAAEPAVGGRHWRGPVTAHDRLAARRVP